MTQPKQQIEQAVAVLQQGGVIAYPTEAVYGLGCDPRNLEAVKKILTLKQRDKAKGLILIASDLSQLEDYLLPLSAELRNKLLRGWQSSARALTWLVPAKPAVSDYLKGRFDTLAVRVSRHPMVRELCDTFAGAIVSTSANVSTEEAARTAQQVRDIFGHTVDYVMEGETDPLAQPSEIRDALTDRVIR